MHTIKNPRGLWWCATFCFPSVQAANVVVVALARTRVTERDTETHFLHLRDRENVYLVIRNPLHKKKQKEREKRVDWFNAAFYITYIYLSSLRAYTHTHVYVYAAISVLHIITTYTKSDITTHTFWLLCATGDDFFLVV